MTVRRPGPLRARHKGSSCTICDREIRTGALIVRWKAAWAHRDCGDAMKARLEVLSGTTFAGQQGTTWRRGRSPGSTA